MAVLGSQLFPGCGSGPKESWTAVVQVNEGMEGNTNESFRDDEQRIAYERLTALIQKRGILEIDLDPLSHGYLEQNGQLVGWTSELVSRPDSELGPQFLAHVKLFNNGFRTGKFDRSGNSHPEHNDTCTVGYADQLLLKLEGQYILLRARELTIRRVPGPDDTQVCFGGTTKMWGREGKIEAELTAETGIQSTTELEDNRIVYHPEHTYGSMARARLKLWLAE
jgi:hypothetical protein